MSVEEIKEFDKQLAQILEFNPEFLDLNPSRSPVPSSSLVSFYDKHLDASLVLKQVKAIPTLPNILSNIVDDAIRDFKAQGPSYSMAEFKKARNPFNSVTDPRDAYFVANRYKDCISNACKAITTKFVLYPYARTWLSALQWDSPRAVIKSQKWFTGEGYSLKLNRTPRPPYTAVISPPLMEALDDSTKALLRDLVAKFPDLATWQLYAASEEAEKILRSMDIASHFDWEFSQTAGIPYTPSVLLRTYDATPMPWTPLLRPPISDPPRDPPRLARSVAAPPEKSTVAANVGPAKSARAKLLRRAQRKPKEPIEVTSRVIPPLRIEEVLNERYTPNANHFLQHAWAQAATHDATFIVFHCGNFERIGIRDRESQTLHLSDVIDVAHCQGPAYGKLELGVYIAILQDAIGRQKAHLKKESTDGRRKRPRDFIGKSVERSSKKAKFAHTPESGTTHTLSSDKEGKEQHNLDNSKKKYSKESVQSARKSSLKSPDDSHVRQSTELKTILKETSRRNLVLIRLHYGVYTSPAPASFIRTGPALLLNVPNLLKKFKQPVRKQSGYSSKDYFTLHLNPEIGHGAVGIVHTARLELEFQGRTLNYDVVVKLAFEPKQKKKMYHEFTVYGRLAEAGVEGVPRVFGFFEDMEGGASALIMTNGGLALPKREAEIKEGQKWNDKGQITVTEVERDAYMRVIEDIHHAGVRHRDIRAWNLLITPSGEVCIIDFDRAELDPADADIQREHADLLNVMNAKYAGVHSWSASSSSSSHASSSVWHHSGSDSSELSFD